MLHTSFPVRRQCISRRFNSFCVKLAASSPGLISRWCSGSGTSVATEESDRNRKGIPDPFLSLRVDQAFLRSSRTRPVRDNGWSYCHTQRHHDGGQWHCNQLHLANWLGGLFYMLREAPCYLQPAALVSEMQTLLREGLNRGLFGHQAKMTRTTSFCLLVE